MYTQQAKLAKAMKNLYAGLNGHRQQGHAMEDALDGGVGAGKGMFQAAKDRQRQMQLDNAAAQLELDKKSRDEYGQNMKDFQAHEQYVQNELSPEQQDTYALNSGQGNGNKSYGDLYGQAMNQEHMKQLGAHLKQQMAIHSAAESTPIDGSTTPRGQSELSNYAKVNGSDQATARGFVRQGMGMSQIGINPEVGY
jgi:hypothetical protein